MSNKAFLKKNGNKTFSLQVFYHTKIVDLLKSFSGVEYNNEERHYICPTVHKDSIINGLLKLNISVQEMEVLPELKPVQLIAYIRESEEADKTEVLVKYSPTVLNCKLLIAALTNSCLFKMLKVFRQYNMKYNHENGSWIIDTDEIEEIMVELKKAGFKIERVVQFPSSTKPKIKVLFLIHS